MIERPKYFLKVLGKKRIKIIGYGTRKLRKQEDR